MTPQTPDMQAVLERLYKVEQQWLWLKVGVVVGFVVLLILVDRAGVGVLHGTVEASKFILEDSGRKTRATLALDPDGPALTLYDKDQQQRIELGFLEGEAHPLLVFDDADGRRRSGLGLNQDTPVFAMGDLSGGSRVPRYRLQVRKVSGVSQFVEVNDGVAITEGAHMPNEV
jgi:hypothetical protein